jgi:hypothetical protein
MREARCLSVKDSCRCRNEQRHDGPHECECGGAWDGKGYIVRFPMGRIGPSILPVPQPGADWRYRDDGTWGPNRETSDAGL